LIGNVPLSLSRLVSIHPPKKISPFLSCPGDCGTVLFSLVELTPAVSLILLLSGSSACRPSFSRRGDFLFSRIALRPRAVSVYFSFTMGVPATLSIHLFFVPPFFHSRGENFSFFFSFLVRPPPPLPPLCFFSMCFFFSSYVPDLRLHRRHFIPHEDPAFLVFLFFYVFIWLDESL